MFTDFGKSPSTRFATLRYALLAGLCTLLFGALGSLLLLRAKDAGVSIPSSLLYAGVLLIAGLTAGFVWLLAWRAARIHASARSESPDQAERLRQEIETLYDRTTDGVIIVDSEWDFIYLNSQAGRLLGRQPEELVGKNAWAEYPEAAEQPLYRVLLQARNEQQVLHLEVHYPPWDRWFDLHGYPSADGNVSFFFRDVTERHISATALADERNLLRSIIDALPDAVYVKDAEHRFIVANQAMADNLNASSPEQILGKTDFDFFPGADAAHFQAQERQLLQTGALNREDEARGVPPLGGSYETERWFRGHKAPLFDASGLVIGLVGVAQDVTEQRQAQDALRASEERFRLLFEETPLSLWEEDYTAIKQRLDRLQDQGIDDLRGYLAVHPEEIAACLSELSVLNVNETSVQMYRAADKTELIQNISRIIPVEQRASIIESYLRVAEGETQFEQEVVDSTLTGEKLVLFMRWTRLPAAVEGEIRVLVALVDITERKQLEEDLRRQALLLDQISDAVAASDENFIIRSWNRAAEAIYGWRADEAIGKRTSEIFQTRFFSGDFREAADSLIAQGHWQDEVVQTRKDGSTLSVLVSLTAVRDNEGNHKGIVGVNRDISELRRAETALRVAEERYRHLFNEAPVMYLALETQNGQPIIRDVNNFYLQTLGYARKEVIGRSGMDFLAADSRQEALGEYPQIVGETGLVTEQSLITRDGRRIDTFVRAVPELDRDGRVVGVLAMYTDISQRKQAERRLQAEAERVRILLRLASRLNQESDLKSVMQAVCEEISVALLAPGVTLSLVDRQKNIFLHGADVGLPAGYEKLTKPVPVPVPDRLKGDLSKLELIHLNPIATLTESPNYAMYVEQKLQLSVNVMLVRDRQLVGSLNLHITDPQRQFGPDDLALLRGVADVVTQAILNAQLRDETLRYADHLEELVNERTIELEAALALAQEADRLKSQFVSDINHELRTPLTNIIFYLGLLTTGKPEKREQYIGVMQREARRLRELIEDVLDLSRLDLGKVPINLQSVNLNRLVEELLVDREALLAEFNLPVSLQPTPELPPVLGDPDLIVRVVTNLLGNALNYTRQGEIRIATGRLWAESVEWQTISVIDTGPGIDPEDLPHLFERFYRGQAARQTGASGTGLGLAICQEIAELHNGRITIESQYGTGSTFTLWLPGDEG